MPYRGAVAQLGERRLCKAEVVGSNPISSTRCRWNALFRGLSNPRKSGSQWSLIGDVASVASSFC